MAELGLIVRCSGTPLKPENAVHFRGNQRGYEPHDAHARACLA